MFSFLKKKPKFKVGDRVKTTHVCDIVSGTILAMSFEGSKSLYGVKTDDGYYIRRLEVELDKVEEDAPKA